jgi:DNA-binding MarR family transcriptional regulator
MAFKYVNMADITRDPPRSRRPGASSSAAPPSEAQAGVAAEKSDLIALVELFFFAYRDFTGDPDAVLAQYGFGRAHHRVLHFVHRNPGLRVANLLEILKITKQSLARVLKQLIGEGFITQKAGALDRRERLLYATVKGARLAERLTALQIKRVDEALAAAGPDAEAATRKFLLAMIGEGDRVQVDALVRGTRPGNVKPGEGDSK